MKRISGRKISLASSLLMRLFLWPSSTPQSIEVLFVIFECFFYFIFVSSRSLDKVHWAFHNGHLVLLLIALVFLIIAKAILKLTLIRPFYIMFLALITGSSHSQQSYEVKVLKIFTYALIAFNLIIDVLSRIQFQVNTLNPHSQTTNRLKLLHYFVLSFTTIVSTTKSTLFEGKTTWIESAIFMCAFSALIFFKLRSACKSIFVKKILIRFYMLVFFEEGQIIISLWMPKFQEIYKHILAIVISQLLCSFLEYHFRKVQVEMQISNGKVVNIVFRLLNYQIGVNFDEEYEKAISDLTSQAQFDEESNEPNAFSDENQFQSRETKKLRKFYKKMEQILQNYLKSPECPPSTTYISMLQAQINIYYKKQLKNAQNILYDAQQKCSRYSLIQKICLFKLDLKIRKIIEQQYKGSNQLYYNEFIDNEKFRTLVVKSSYDHLNLWDYLNKRQYLTKRLTGSLNRVIKRRKIVDQFYEKQLKVKCVSIISIYMNYLKFVRQDLRHAISILREFELNLRSQHNFHVDMKVYMALGLEVGDLLKIENIGFNVKRLLGYQRENIVKSNISQLLPSFFAQIHEQMFIKTIQASMSQQLFHLKKSVIIKHSLQYYLPCIVEFKLVYNIDGKLMLEGYVQIINDFSYNWSNYFFIKSQVEQIVEVGPDISNIIELRSGMITHCSQYFTNQASQSNIKTIKTKSITTVNFHQYKTESETNPSNFKKYLEHDNVLFEYDLLKEFNADENNSRFLYYVCKSSNGHAKKTIHQQTLHRLKYHEVAQNPNSTPNSTIQKSTNIYISEKKVIIAAIKEKTIFRLFVLCVFALVLGLAIQAANILRIQRIYDESNALRNDFKTLIDFYNSLSELGINVCGYHIRAKYRYPYELRANWADLCIQLEKTNHLLSKYSKKQYQYLFHSLLTYKTTAPKIIDKFISNIFINTYTYDRHLIQYSIQTVHRQILLVFNEAAIEYIDEFRNEIVSFANYNRVVTCILSGVIFGCAIVLLVLIIKMSLILQGNKFKTLQLFTKINASSEVFINTISEYLRTISGEVDRKEYLGKWHEDLDEAECSRAVKDQTNRKVMNENQPTFRENSVRGLINQESQSQIEIWNKNNQIWNKNNNQIWNKKNKNDEEKVQNTLRKPKWKKFIIFWIFISFAIILVPSSYFVYEKASNVVTLKTSMLSLIKLFNKHVHFSNTVIIYVDTVSHNGDYNNELYKQLKHYTVLASENILFDELKYYQFADFAEIFSKLTYANLCQYMECNPLYSNYVNIIHSTLIDKIHNFMRSNMNDGPIANNSFEFKSILYAHKLLDLTITRVLSVYNANYEDYEKKTKGAWLAFSYSEVAVLLFGFTAVILFYFVYVRREQQKYLDILGIIQEDDEIGPDDY